MAAYNCGAGAVDRAVERTGYADYWELLRRGILPKETANYVPIIVAMTIIGKNPQEYGFDNIAMDDPAEYESISLTAPTHLDLIADATLQPVSLIRDLNPSLLGRVAPAGFRIHVPAGAGPATQEALETVPAGNRHAWRLHHVSHGDTLTAIASSYHLTPDRIAAVNRGYDSFEVGDTLLIPALDPPVQRRAVNAYRITKGRRMVTRTRSNHSSVSQRATHVSASRRVPTQALHRKAAVRIARLK
jgi:membrane-bound lytic murein transglycosylase D